MKEIDDALNYGNTTCMQVIKYIILHNQNIFTTPSKNPNNPTNPYYHIQGCHN